MGKYGQLIEQARAEAENQTSGKPESVKPRKPANQKTRKMENQKTRLPDGDDEQVNLGVKVPLSWRRHWAAEAKRAGISMTEIIIDALIKRLGKPE